MRKYIAIIAMGTGVLLLAAAGFLLLAADATPTYAQIPAEAEYVGERECSSCHRDMDRAHEGTRHALTLQKSGGNDNPILGDFTQGDDVRQVQFPGEDTARAFTAADIAFAVGSGRHIQRYLYEVGEDEYAVFPAEWNAVEKTWQPYTLAANWPDPAYDFNRNCAGCHTTGLDTGSGKWEDEGVQCESCHGPGSVHVDTVDEAGHDLDAEELAAARAAIVASPDAQICGQCHSQGTSESGDRPYPVGYRPGDNLLDGSVYTLVAPDDSAHWRASGHAASQNMQYNEWLTSRHAASLDSLKASDYADDSCLRCHSADYRLWEREMAAVEAGGREGDPPQPPTLDTARSAVTCLSCHDVHGAGEFDYDLVAKPYELCVECHGDTNRIEQVHHPVQEMYEGATVVENVPGVPSKHFTQGVLCTTCHMPPSLQTGQTWYAGSHTMKPAMPAAVAEGQPDSCTGCHTDLTPAYMQQFVEKTQSQIFERLSNVTVALGTTPNAPDWTQAAVEFVQRDGSLGVHNFSYASTLLDTVEVQLGLTQNVVLSGIPVQQVENPIDCAGCHADQYRKWQTSPHANASLSESFQKEFADKGQPSYCMRCHASGYDPRTANYVFEGVVCSNCHFVTGGAKHPPGPVEVANDSAVCGRCHSGEHAPTYDEWLASPHSAAGIDCADCHSPHDNGLKLGDVNKTCASCHQEAMVDQIHMSKDMNCVDCHMAERTTQSGEHVIQTGHTMNIDPGVCANCHGEIHLLSAGTIGLSEQQRNELSALQDEVVTLRDQASESLNSGIVGGAIGALALVVIVFIVLRVGRKR